MTTWPTAAAVFSNAAVVFACCSSMLCIVGPSGLSEKCGMDEATPSGSKHGAGTLQCKRSSFQTNEVGKSVSSQSKKMSVSCASCHCSRCDTLVLSVRLMRSCSDVG
eukprot:CAMPEP_0172867352 /NCGR_PEP_ID=MMETSP1075-20121228/83405_1 /TAXON_ID=2916 /ORGANISM="Ceratium fusus, Strain PA161109" /LENGTH=106 /DNA_ID=CAMNT_0013716701 /DNA_START=218 /DNA_END=538 /DNA_ORIENTATION=-